MTSDEVLLFWFGHIPGAKLGVGRTRQLCGRLPYWAGKWGRLVADVDGEMKRRFSDDLVAAGRGEHDDWAATPSGRLALILLLDQFGRNIHRGTPGAFVHDAKSLALALEGLDRGEDKLVYPLARSFLYLPLVHKEQLDFQERAVALYREARQQAGGLEWVVLQAEYVSAVRHRQIIRQFGRFPHRNDILGRVSTAEERRFLKQPFSSF